MDSKKTGALIRELRRQKGLTQEQLAARLSVSGKAVSKWETGAGCPDISMLNALSRELQVPVEALLSGALLENEQDGGNMKNTRYFVCPVCGSITLCTGEAAISCCGRSLEPMSPCKAPEDQRLSVETVEDDWYISADHPMEKDHYISFVALAQGDRVQLVKQYPEWEMHLRLPKRGRGMLVWYCTRHGLFWQPLI